MKPLKCVYEDFYLRGVGGRVLRGTPYRLPLDFSDFLSSVRGTTARNSPPWPSTIGTICLSGFRIRSLGKEHGTNKPINQKDSGMIRKQEEMPAHMSYQPPRILFIWNPPGWAMSSPLGKTLSQDGLARDNSETQPHHHKTWDCESHGRAVLLGSPWPPPLPAGTPSQWSLLLGQHYSAALEEVPPSCNISTSWQTPQSLFK